MTPTTPAHASLPTLLTVEECAALARTAGSTVRHWISTGRLAARRPGRRVLVSRAALCAFLNVTPDELAGATVGPKTTPAPEAA